MKQRPKKRKISLETRNRHLRSGSKEVKRILMEQNPFCDICGGTKKLQLHHIYLVRHGFSTKLEWSVLLCVDCHRLFHHKFDKYLDITFKENPNIDFRKIYDVLKHIMLSGSH